MDKGAEKMPDRMTEIENYVLVGKVLDEHGAWIPIADKKTTEETFVAHLAAGKVLLGGRWVTIGEAKAAQQTSKSGSSNSDGSIVAAGSERLTDRNGVPIDFAPETAAIAGDLPLESDVEYPPETKKMLITPPELQRGDPGSGNDPVSNYAVETGLYTIDRGADETRPPERSSTAPVSGKPSDETKRMPVRPLWAAPPSTPSWETKSGGRAKRVLLIATIIGLLAAGGAVVAFVMFGAK
jgi:hypothetical protein